MEVITTIEKARYGVLPSKPVVRFIVLALLAVMASVSTYVGIKEAAFSDPGKEGIDFQWSGANLLSRHEDPWKLFIDHQDKGKIILGQQPNYLAEMFLLLQPLGRMPFQEAVKWWCGLNLIFTGCILYILRKMFALDRDHVLLLTFLLMASMPFRVTLHNGQHSLFVLLMLCIVFYPRNPILKGVALGLSYAKYSFAPVIVMMLLVRRRIGIILISMIPPLAGLLIAWHLLGGSLTTLALEPFAVAKIAMGPGSADIMTFAEAILRRLPISPSLIFFIPSVVGLLAAATCAMWIGRSRRMDDSVRFAVVLIVTLLCLKHVEYDFVVLAVPVAAAIMAPRSKAQAIVILCALHFWLLGSIINYVHLTQDMFALKVLIYGLLLLVMAIATSRLYPELSLDARP